MTGKHSDTLFFAWIISVPCLKYTWPVATRPKIKTLQLHHCNSTCNLPHYTFAIHHLCIIIDLVVGCLSHILAHKWQPCNPTPASLHATSSVTPCPCMNNSLPSFTSHSYVGIDSFHFQLIPNAATTWKETFKELFKAYSRKLLPFSPQQRRQNNWIISLFVKAVHTSHSPPPPPVPHKTPSLSMVMRLDNGTMFSSNELKTTVYRTRCHQTPTD